MCERCKHILLSGLGSGHAAGQGEYFAMKEGSHGSKILALWAEHYKINWKHSGKFNFAKYSPLTGTEGVRGQGSSYASQNPGKIHNVNTFHRHIWEPGCHPYLGARLHYSNYSKDFCFSCFFPWPTYIFPECSVCLMEHGWWSWQVASSHRNLFQDNEIYYCNI